MQKTDAKQLTLSKQRQSALIDYPSRGRQLFDDCMAHLEGYSDEQILQMSQRDSDDPDGTRKAWLDLHWSEINFLRKKPLPWYAGGFGHPDFVAEFEHSCKMPRLSIDETLLLSVGVEPVHFKARELKDLQSQDHSKFWSPLRFLVRRRDHLNRRFNSQDCGWTIAPGDFIKWPNRWSSKFIQNSCAC